MSTKGSGIGRAIAIACAATLSFVIPASALAHHGGPEHLPAVQQNLTLVGEVELKTSFGDVSPGQIADLAVYKGYAYLNSWDEPTCAKGGTYVADITDPTKPKEVGFIPASGPGYYHGEGAQVITIDTLGVTRDILAVNNEACSYPTKPASVNPASGGFDLYDVTDPRNPVTLVQNAGDDDAATPANSYHSVFVWQDGPNAYLVASDNTEFEDVDIFDITDPTAPVQLADLDILTSFPQVEDPQAPNGNTIFHHDVVVKEIDGVMTMLVSYWDAGYVQLDVDNPAAPTYISDSDFPAVDPLVPGFSPEGNAHQAEYSFDGQYYLAGDEDFATDRLAAVEITTGPNAGDFDGNSIGGAAPVANLADGVLNGPTVYGGYGCDASAAIPPRASAGLPPLEADEEAIVVLQRGPGFVGTPPGHTPDDPEGPEDSCFPGEKAANAIDAGYDAVLLVNHHRGEAAGVFCGSGGFPPTPPIVAVCTTHEAYHHIFMTPPSTTIPYDPAAEPDIGDLGEYVSAEADFDGWGYAHLYDAATNAEVDAFAIPEGLDPTKASGFGDLTIHEFAADPQENLAYAAYYAGGMRVFRFGPTGLEQTGAFIDADGSNFWGVEQFTTAQGRRLIAGSDRDFGLQIFCYTGPSTAPASALPCPVPAKGTTPGNYGENDPPQTQITKKPKKKSTKRKAKFKFTSDEANSTFQCKLDRKAFKACSSPYKKRVKRGRHKFQVRAIDPAGNVDPTPAKYRWKVKKKG